MPDPRPASVVIPFPRSDDPQVQLRRALAGLNSALAEQRREVARWRDSLDELRSAVSSIDTSLHLFRDSLDAVAPAVSGLEAEAARLQHLTPPAPG